MATTAASAASFTRLEALYEVSRALNSSLHLEDALTIVVNSAIRLTAAERGFLMLVDEGGRDVHFALGRNAAREPIYESEFEISHSVLQEVARSAQPVVTFNAQKDPRFTKKSSVVHFALRSIMAVPLKSGERVVGVLYVDSKTREVQFGPPDLELLSAFADQAATAIVNAQLFETQKRDAEVRRVQWEVARAAQSVGGVAELLQALADSLPKWLDCDQCAVYVWNAETEEFQLSAFTRDGMALAFRVLETIWANMEPWRGRLRAEAQPFLVPPDHVAGFLPLTDWNIAPYPLLAVPLRSETALFGWLTLDNARRPRAFSAQTLEVTGQLGEPLATAIQHLRLYETAQRQLRELSVLHAVAVAASKADDVEDLTVHVAQVMQAAFPLAGFSIMLVDQRAGVLRLSPGSVPTVVAGLTVPLDQGVTGYVARTGQACRVPDVSLEPMYLNLVSDTQSEVCVPLKLDERVIGVINAESAYLNAFTPADERFLGTIAGQLATALHKLRLLEEERQQRELAETLRDVSFALNVDLGLETAFGRLLDYISRVVPYDAACVQLIEHGYTRMVGMRGYERFGEEVLEATRELRLEVARASNLRRMIDSGRPVIVADVLVDDLWVNRVAAQHLRSWVGAPIMVQERCVAYLSLDKCEPRFYRDEHAELLASFAGQAALAMQNVWLFQAAEERAAELDAIRSASLSLTSSLDLKVVLNAILEGVFKLLTDVQDAHIYIYEDDRVVFGAALWADGRRGEAFSEPRPDGLTYTVAREGEALFVPDMRAHPLFGGRGLEWDGAIVGLPLKFGARVVGVMNVGYHQPRAFSDSEIRILRLLGEQAAAAIENARLFEATRRQLEELSVLHAVATAGAESTSVDRLIERATEMIGNTLKADHFGVMLLDESGLVLEPHASYRGLPDVSVPIGQGIIGRVAVTARPWRIDDVRREAAQLGTEPDTLSELCVPLRAGDRVLGVVNVESGLLNAFSAADERLLTTFASQLATAIEKARLFEAERAARAQAETLRDVANRLNSTLDRGQLYDLLLEQLARLVQYDSASIMLVEEGRYYIAASRGFRSLEQRLTSFEIAGLRHVQQILADRQPLMIADTASDSRWKTMPDTEYIRCWLGVPLVAEDRIIGVLNLDKDEAGYYTSHDAEIAMALANQGAVALERLRLLAETLQHERELSILLDVARAVSSSIQFGDVVQHIAAAIAQALNMDACALSAYEPDRREVYSLAWHARVGPPDEIFPGQRFNLSDYPATASAIDQDSVEVVRVDSPSADSAEKALLQRSGYAVLLMFSIRSGDRPVGLVELFTRDTTRDFLPADLSLARAVADQTSIALENARLFLAEREQRELAEALRDTAAILSASLDFETVLDRLLDQIGRVVPYDAANIMLIEGGRARVVRRRGYEQFGLMVDADIERLGLEVAATPNLQRLISTGQPLIVSDVLNEPGWIPVGATRFLRSWAGAPITALGQTIALFSIEKIEPSFYQPKHVERLAAFAGQAALALQNARLFDTERRRVTMLTALHDISLDLSAQLSRPTLLNTILDNALRLLDAQMCTFYDVDWERNDLELVAARHLPEDLRGTRIRMGEGVAGLAALRDAPVVIDDYEQWPERLSAFSTLQARSVLGVPLKWQGQLRGVITIVDRRPFRFSEVGVDVISLFADQVAIALENVRLYEALTDEKLRLELLYNLSQSLAATLSPQEVAQRALDLTRATLGAYKAALWVFDPGRQSLSPLRVSGYAARWTPAFDVAMPLGNGFVGRAAATRQVGLSANVAADPHWIMLPELDDDIQSAVAIPLLAGDTLVGVLTLLSDKPDFYGEEQLPLLRAAATPVALALQNARLFDETRRRAEELAALTEVTAALRIVETPAEVMPILLRHSLQVCQADAGAIVVMEADGAELRVASAEGQLTAILGQRLPADHSIAGHVFRTGRPYTTADLVNDPLAHAPTTRAWLTDTRARAALYAPLRSGQALVGVISITAPAPRVFNEADVRLLTAIAEVGGNALQRARVLETLEQRVAERTHELEQANERLKELDRLKDVFVSTVSHELRTPLTAIKLHLGLLEKRGAEVLPRYLPILQRETERLRRLIEDLLDLSRLRAQTAPLKREPHRLEALLADVLMLHSTRAEERNVIFVQQMARHLPTVPVDQTQIIQVFTNLVGNAVAYSPAGGRVVVTVQPDRYEEQAGVTVSVQNGGDPIPDEDRPYIFTRFYRGQTARDSGEPGTGLGLAISKEIVERHGGHIAVESSPALGTLFTVWLPLTGKTPSAR
jgi:GAF domain-containing protein